MVDALGFEPKSRRLKVCCSTTELNIHGVSCYRTRDKTSDSRILAQVVGWFCSFNLTKNHLRKRVLRNLLLQASLRSEEQYSPCLQWLGIEVSILCLLGQNQAYYRCTNPQWSGRRDLNPQHPVWKTGALPIELLPHIWSQHRESNPGQMITRHPLYH